MPKGYETFSTLNPQQQQAFSQLLGILQGQMGGGFGQEGQDYFSKILGGDTSAFEAPLMRQFNEQIVPELAERFSGLGVGSQNSSAFQQALSSSGADLAERLGSLRGQLQSNAAQQSLGFGQNQLSNLQNLLGMNTQGLVPKSKPWWQEALIGGVGGLGQGLGMAAGGGMSGGISSLMSILKNLFGGSSQPTTSG